MDLSHKPHYCREVQFFKLLGILPAGIDNSLEGRRALVALLTERRNTMRSLGERKHFAYDLNRHLALNEALREEQAALNEMELADARHRFEVAKQAVEANLAEIRRLSDAFAADVAEIVAAAA